MERAWEAQPPCLLAHSQPFSSLFFAFTDLSSQETGLSQEWSSVEEDDESEDSQVCIGITTHASIHLPTSPSTMPFTQSPTLSH